MRGRRNPESNIELGLAVSALSLREGQTRTYQELSAYCGVSRRAMEKIGEKALRKLRVRLGKFADEVF